MKKSTQKVALASHTLNRKRKKKSIMNSDKIPGPSFVTYDSNNAEDLSILTSSQSTLASIVNVDEDEDGSSIGSKVAPIPLQYTTSSVALEEEGEGLKVASTSEREWACESCTYNHCGKKIEFLTCALCGTARPSETQLRASRRSNRIKKS
jgi:hypothetical protein